MMATIAQIEARAQKQFEDGEKLYYGKIKPIYGKLLKRYDDPLPPYMLGMYIAHESAGKRWATTKYPEVGLAMLTCQKGKDDEVGNYKLDPFDPEVNIAVVQLCFQDMMLKLDCFGYFIAFLARSIGFGITKRLIAKVSVSRSDIVNFVMDPKNEEWIRKRSGQQTVDTVRLRVKWSELVHRNNPLYGPTVKEYDLTGLPPLPSDFYSRIGYYAANARREGPFPLRFWK